MAEVLVLLVVYAFDWLTITYPEGGKSGSWPSFYEFGYGAFGGFGDLETYGSMLRAGVPWGIAHAMPLVYGGYGNARSADQADPSTVGYGAPPVGIPFGTTMLASKDQLGSGFNPLHLNYVVALFRALLFLCKLKEGIGSWLLQPRCTSFLLDVPGDDLSSTLVKGSGVLTCHLQAGEQGNGFVQSFLVLIRKTNPC